MSVATLLNPSDPNFDWDHDQLHRQMYAAAPNGSAIPYGLGDMSDIAVPAGWFNTLHAQAHQDFAAAVPRIFWPSVVHINDVTTLGEDWALANRVLHNLALSVL